MYCSRIGRVDHRVQEGARAQILGVPARARQRSGDGGRKLDVLGCAKHGWHSSVFSSAFGLLRASRCVAAQRAVPARLDFAGFPRLTLANFGTVGERILQGRCQTWRGISISLGRGVWLVGRSRMGRCPRDIDCADRTPTSPTKSAMVSCRRRHLTIASRTIGR